MPDHDHSYKLLFSHPQMVRDLLEGFVRADWLAQLDYSSLERVNSSYVSDDLRDRADDVVWRVRWGKDWVYIYLLIEFQSTVERYMAVRTLTYVGLLYQDLIRTRQLSPDRKLPPVLPIVLYNGAARWGAPGDIGSLIQAGPRALERYRPQGRYLLIDERRYRDSELVPLRNLVAALFRLENSRSHADISKVLSLLVEWLKSPEQASLRRAFAVWINRVILGKLPGGPVAGVEDLQAMGTLFEERLQDWAEGYKREGLQQGEALLLCRLLRKRFGELPGWVWPRLQQAQSAQLEQWGERLLEVDSLDALFAAGPATP
jgi:hypothetical protein